MIVQWLCKKAIEEGKRPIVVRFSGGPQAAHTINHNGIEHICSSFGSGVLLGVPTMLYDNTYIDPISLVKEYDSLVSKGEFKVGALETTLMNRATERHRIDNYVSQFDCRLNLVVTHMDVVVDSGVFEYGQKFGKNAIVGAIEPKKVLEAITSHLDIPFDNVYYNDSIESNIKQML